MRPTVLIVDDEPLVARALARALGAFSAVELASAREALGRIAAGERFDLVLCDLMMPGMTGMELFEEVSRVSPAQAARMVFMTGGAFTEGAREFLEREGVRWVEKPVDTDQLRLVILGRAA